MLNFSWHRCVDSIFGYNLVEEVGEFRYRSPSTIVSISLDCRIYRHFLNVRKHVEAYQMISGRLRPNGGQWIGQESGVGEAEFGGKAGVKPPQQFN
jgi:hypothetical protein